MRTYHKYNRGLYSGLHTTCFYVVMLHAVIPYDVYCLLYAVYVQCSIAYHLYYQSATGCKYTTTCMRAYDAPHSVLKLHSDVFMFYYLYFFV